MSAGAGPRLVEVDAALAGRAALPRDNGELVFEEPWQGRVLRMGVVVLERTGASWEEFRCHLVAAIWQHPPEPGESAASAYYAAWLGALEVLLAERGLLPWSQSPPLPGTPTSARCCGSTGDGSAR